MSDADSTFVPLHPDCHPSPLCESASLHGTPSPLPVHSLACTHPPHVVSPLQADTVRRMMDALLSTGTFVLGDGTGVGKGRTLAALTREWTETFAPASTCVLWISANARLQEDAKRELRVVGMGGEGEVRTLHGRVRSGEEAPPSTPPPLVLLASYTGILLHRTPRLAAERVLVLLDECHTLRHARMLFCAVQELLQRAAAATTRDGRHRRSEVAVVFSSATCMSEAAHLAYLAPRTCLLASRSVPDAPYDSLAQMMRSVKRSGSAVMELVCLHLKVRGQYLCRQLSMEGVRVETVEAAAGSPREAAERRRLYDCAVRALRGRDPLLVQRTLLRLAAAFKAAAAIRVAEAALRRGESVVLCVASTGAASTERAIGRGEREPVSSVEEALRREEEDDEDRFRRPTAPLDLVDALVDHFGAARVAEMTGRTRRYVRDRLPAASASSWRVEAVPPVSDEAASFQAGDKRVCIVSKAGGVGVSLHDPGGAPRHLVVVELSWSCEDTMQVLGRVHRTAGNTPPSYTLLTSDLPAERRIVHSLFRRIRTLGALTRGDRTACDTLRLRDGTTVGAATTARERRLLASCALLAERVVECETAPPLPTSAPLLPLADLVPLGSSASTTPTLRGTSSRKTASTHQQLLELVERGGGGGVGSATRRASEAEGDGTEEEGSSPSPRTPPLLHLLDVSASASVPCLVRWSPATHRCFSATQRRWVVRFLCACNVPSSPLSLLPTSIALYVAQLCLWAGDDAKELTAGGDVTDATAAEGGGGVRATTTRGRRHAWSSVPLRSHESLLNAVVRMPVQRQEAVVRLLDHVQWWEREEADRTGASSTGSRRRTVGGAIPVEEEVERRLGARAGAARVVSVEEQGEGRLVVRVNVDGERRRRRERDAASKRAVTPRSTTKGHTLRLTVETTRAVQEWDASLRTLVRLPPVADGRGCGLGGPCPMRAAVCLLTRWEAIEGGE